MERKYIKELDKLWAKTVKDKAKWKCEHCGKIQGRMEAAHVVGRRHRATRWGFAGCDELPNGELCGHCFCHVCHQMYDEHGPLETDIVEKTIGKERKEKLQEIATRRVTTFQEYEVVKCKLEVEGIANDDSPFGKLKE